jgi:tetratricopeptide (TPR) repeat protein
MKQRNFKNENQLKTLVFEYEVLSQQGTVCFYEETVFVDISVYYENQNRIDHALDVIDHAIEQNRYSPLLLVRKAELLLLKNCTQTALDLLDDAELLAPGDFYIKIVKIEVMIELGQFNKALAISEDISEDVDKRSSSHLYYLRALIFEAKRKYVKMFRNLCKAVQADPKNTTALKKLWLGTELSKCFEESVAVHTYVIDQQPFSAIAWYNLGHAFLKLEKHIDADEAFEYALLIDKTFEDAYRDCAEVRIRMKDYERALECYEEMLCLFQPDAALYVNIGYCYEQMDKIDLALVCYEKSFKYSYNNDWAYFRKGACFMRMGLIEQAINCLEEAIHLNKNKELYMNMLAEAYYAIGEDEKADELFYKATGAAPDICSPWITYARFLISKGKAQQAMDLMEEAEIYAVGIELVYCKAACLFLLQKRVKGFAMLKLALRQNYNKHYFLFDICPALKEDVEVIIMISTFKG